MSDDLQQYLRVFVQKAAAAGLPVRNPGMNWAPLAPLTTGSHVSLSVAGHRIQVNLNNDDDADRSKFEVLHTARATIEQEIGEGLTWEKKEGRKKTAIRASKDLGYEDGDWDAQHDWAIDMISHFQRSFGTRLA